MKKITKKITKMNSRAAGYRQVTHREHVYGPGADNYIGCTEPVSRVEWFYVNGKYEKHNTSIPPGLVSLYKEILDNAVDNARRTQRKGQNPGQILVTFDEMTISVTNYGDPIPIAQTQTVDGRIIYLPQMIFGEMLSSSNYTDNRQDGGKNGIGAKATNIFSKWFCVIVCDAVSQIKYTQIWKNNMLEVNPPILEPYTENYSQVTISYVADFLRFGMNTGNTPEILSLYQRLLFDKSYLLGIPVVFNNEHFNFSEDKNYAALCFGEEASKEIILHKQLDNAGFPVVRLMIADTPGAGSFLSFVNGLPTNDGGVHVIKAYEAFGHPLVKLVNQYAAEGKKPPKTGKTKSTLKVKETKPKEEKPVYSINISEVKNHVSIILAVEVVNPHFGGQTKSKLESGKMDKIAITDETLKKAYKWKMMDRLYAAVQNKHFNALAAEENSKKRIGAHLGNYGKGVDANFADTSKRNQTSLIITEGKSGKGYADTFIALNKASDYYGILPIQGKLLNCAKHDLAKIMSDKEIKVLRGMLGLQMGANYTDPSILNTLRYGSLLIMTDADLDGYHILGLIINFLYVYCPSLLAIGYVRYWRTPIVKFSGNKNENFYFYNLADSEKWYLENGAIKNWDRQYFKGLGGSEKKDIEMHIREPKTVIYLYDEHASYYINLVFGKEMETNRKIWMYQNRVIDNYIEVAEITYQPISHFLNNEVLEYSISTITRAIPSLLDSFKDSQRKIIYVCLEKVKVWKNGRPPEKNEVKVSQLGGMVAGNTDYVHGESNISKTIIGLARNYCGTNNLNLLYPKGQFGNTISGSEAASQDRYIHTYPEKILELIIKKEDKEILDYNIDCGEKYEPSRYYMTIPLILVNGGKGIATGFSSRIPAHNPLDIIIWLKNRLTNAPSFPMLVPWYRSFTGKITLVDRKKKQDTVDDSDLYNEINGVIVKPSVSMISYGVFEQQGNNILVSVLPIEVWADKYLSFIKNNLLAENLIDSYTKYSSFDEYENECNQFLLINYKGKVNHKALGLISSFAMSNMVVLNNNNIPCKYNSAEELIEAFYQLRLPLFQKRKDYLISEIDKKIRKCNELMAFILAYLEGKLIINRRAKKDILQDMIQLGLNTELLSLVKIVKLTKDELDKNLEKIAKLQEERKIIENKTLCQMWYDDLQELHTSLCNNNKLLNSYLRNTNSDPNALTNLMSYQERLVYNQRWSEYLSKENSLINSIQNISFA